MRMNLNDLNQLLDLLLIHEGAIISFSEENVEYLKEETEIKCTQQKQMMYRLIEYRRLRMSLTGKSTFPQATSGIVCSL